MNSKRIGTTVLVLAIAVLPMMAKVVSTPVQEKKTKSETGIYYALPKTTLKLKVTTALTTRLQGPYFRYAGRYLGEENIIAENSSSWEIRGIEITTTSSADSTQVYQLSAGKCSVANLLTLDENGLIKVINGNATGLPCSEPQALKVDLQTPALQFDKRALSEEVLIANSTAKMAELAAKQIYRIRENRASLVTGDLDYPSDGASFKMMLDEMNRMEQSLVELFVGKEVVQTRVTEIEYTPTGDGDDVVFRFSEQEGIVDKEDLSGKPCYIETHVERLPLNLNPKQKKGTIAYRLPALVNVSISYDNKTLLNGTVNVAQLGEILWVPKKLLQKNMVLIFDPVNGQLRQVEKAK